MKNKGSVTAPRAGACAVQKKEKMVCTQTVVSAMKRAGCMDPLSGSTKCGLKRSEERESPRFELGSV